MSSISVRRSRLGWRGAFQTPAENRHVSCCNREGGPTRAFSLLVCTANTVEVWLFLGKATPKDAAL
jgi:hypothetical protein